MSLEDKSEDILTDLEPEYIYLDARGDLVKVPKDITEKCQVIGAWFKRWNKSEPFYINRSKAVVDQWLDDLYHPGTSIHNEFLTDQSSKVIEPAKEEVITDIKLANIGCRVKYIEFSCDGHEFDYQYLFQTTDITRLYRLYINDHEYMRDLPENSRMLLGEVSENLNVLDVNGKYDLLPIVKIIIYEFRFTIALQLRIPVCDVEKWIE